MKKLVLTFVMLFVGCLLFTGCGNSGAPECSSSDVTKLVIDITTTKFKDQLTNQVIMEQGKWVPDNTTYEILKQQMKQVTAEEKAELESIIKLVDKKLSDFSFSLEGFRTDSCDDKTRKCQCGANMVISNSDGTKTPPLSIKYTAQYTEDGKIYVEVFGL